jgi:arylsulfatase A-like enzyme
MYGDVIEELDWSVGQSARCASIRRIERNTLVLFTSDNGPWLPFRDHGGSAGPLEAGERHYLGRRSANARDLLVAGTVRPGVVAGIGSALDVLATVASLAGVAIPADRPLDSVNLSAALKGTGPSGRNELFYYWDDELRAVRKGQLQGALHHQRRVRRPRAARHAQPAIAL